MAYQKQQFKNYAVLTAEQLNHIEDGIMAVENNANSRVKTVNGRNPDINGNVNLPTSDGTVKTVNGVAPDESGNVKITIPDSGGNVSYNEAQKLTEDQKAQARENIGAQPSGTYLTEVPEGYAKTEDIPSLEGYAKTEDILDDIDDIRKVLNFSSIVEIVRGFSVSVSNASDLELVGLKVYGKTTQNGTPTPDAPVPLENVGDGGSVTIKVGISETDGNPQTLTVQKPTDVPVFLPGILVSSGGNHTDENGQQWICDEVDFKKGVYTQRIGKFVVDNTTASGCATFKGYKGGRIAEILYSKLGISPAIRTPKLCDRLVCSTLSPSSYANCAIGEFGYNTTDMLDNYLYINVGEMENTAEVLAYLQTNPLTFEYILATPIEHDLTAEELAQYAALHTNYPNTTIYNDGGADMEVKYVADTKLYIDKKFAELSTALLNQ